MSKSAPAKREQPRRHRRGFSFNQRNLCLSAAILQQLNGCTSAVAKAQTRGGSFIFPLLGDQIDKLLDSTYRGRRGGNPLASIWIVANNILDPSTPEAMRSAPPYRPRTVSQTGAAGGAAESAANSSSFALASAHPGSPA